MTPTTDHFNKADGWQDLCTTGCAPNLSYNLKSSNDVVKIRFQFADTFEITGDVAEIGIGLSWTFG